MRNINLYCKLKFMNSQSSPNVVVSYLDLRRMDVLPSLFWRCKLCRHRANFISMKSTKLGLGRTKV